MVEPTPSDTQPLASETGPLPGLGPAALARPSLLRPGTTVAERYRVEGVLGRGGMGVVYLAHDVEAGREVALKLLSAELGDDVDLARFQREAELAAQAAAGGKAGFARIHARGEHEGRPFFVMERLPGEDLERLLREGLPRAGALDSLQAVAQAVHACHEAGVIHRDLKPSNILIDAAGRPRVADFGLAVPAARVGELTRTGELLGTPAYMAPEQLAAGQLALDRRADVYALGAILYRILTGRPPFRGSLVQVLHQVASSEPLPPRELVPDVDPALEAVCLQALAKDPVQRYPSAQALAEDLARARRGESVEARGAAALARRRAWRRAQGPLALGLLLALALGAVAWRASGWQRRAFAERDLVRLEAVDRGGELTTWRLGFGADGDPGPLLGTTLRRLSEVEEVLGSRPQLRQRLEAQARWAAHLHGREVPPLELGASPPDALTELVEALILSRSGAPRREVERWLQQAGRRRLAQSDEPVLRLASWALAATTPEGFLSFDPRSAFAAGGLNPRATLSQELLGQVLEQGVGHVVAVGSAGDEERAAELDARVGQLLAALGGDQDRLLAARREALEGASGEWEVRLREAARQADGRALRQAAAGLRQLLLARPPLTLSEAQLPRLRAVVVSVEDSLARQARGELIGVLGRQEGVTALSQACQLLEGLGDLAPPPSVELARAIRLANELPTEQRQLDLAILLTTLRFGIVVDPAWYSDELGALVAESERARIVEQAPQSQRAGFLAVACAQPEERQARLEALLAVAPGPARDLHPSYLAEARLLLANRLLLQPGQEGRVVELVRQARPDLRARPNLFWASFDAECRALGLEGDELVAALRQARQELREVQAALPPSDPDRRDGYDDPRWLQAESAQRLALACLQAEDTAGALAAQREAYQLLLALDDREEVSEVHAGVVRLLLARGELNAARELLERHATAWSGQHPATASAAVEVALAQSQFARAEVLLLEAERYHPEAERRWAKLRAKLEAELEAERLGED